MLLAEFPVHRKRTLFTAQHPFLKPIESNMTFIMSILNLSLAA